MASILDDLKGVLSPEEFAKIEGNAALKTRVARGDELRSYYDGDEPPPVQQQQQQNDPPPVRTAPPGTGGTFDLGAIERMLDTKLGTINTTIDTRIADVVKTRGDELYNNVRAGVRSDALQLVKIYTRHEKATGKEWDDAEEVKFNDFLKVNNEAVKTGGGKRYATISEAYNDYIAPVITERTIETEVDKRVRAKSGQHVIGTTPAPATNSNIRSIMSRGKTGDPNAPATGAGRAAAMLDRLEQSRAANVA